MEQKNIRNVAIIAHVDHGKTTLVDELFKQSGMWRDNQVVEVRLMDSMDLERERGITIKSKNGSCHYNGVDINIIDTPGHADFGGEVERVLKMADGAVFVVDAAEGPMPQSYFVLKKAVALNLPVIVVVNKIDKAAARCDWVVDQVFDLLVSLNAPDEILDFPVVYASAKEGYAQLELDKKNNDMTPLLETIVARTPAPSGDPESSLQLLISSISHSAFMGTMAIGKVINGTIKVNDQIALARNKEVIGTSRVTKIHRYKADKEIEITQAITGDIVAISGVANVKVGDTVTDPANPRPVDAPPIDPPTISMTFLPNDSPFSGTEGEFVTSNHVRDRLERELLTDVALQVDLNTEGLGFKVSGRGELHLSILIEKMRREGYEFQVSRPQVLIKIENGKKLEPYEKLTVDVPEAFSGKVIETLGARKGSLEEMTNEGDLVRLKYRVPTRGLLGYQAEFMTHTKGQGVMNYVFDSYGEFVGSIKTRKNGVLVVKENCTTIAFSLCTLQDRGVLFMGAGEKVYGGQILGENSREDDLVVNPGKGKKLTNMRASGTDDNVVLIPFKSLSLEQCIAFITDDELVEVTPKAIRIRKRYLSEGDRKRAKQL
jgi:GTP-binding protein